MYQTGELNRSVAPEKGYGGVGTRSRTEDRTAFGFRAGLCYLTGGQGRVLRAG